MRSRHGVMKKILDKIRRKIVEMRKIYCGLRLSGGYAFFPALVRLVQATYFSMFRKEEYGVMMSYDYIYFKHPEIYRTMFTNKENAALLPLVNDQESIYLLRQKHLLPGRLGDMGRRFLSVSRHSAEEVRDFLAGEGGYIIKPDEGSGSCGISFLYSEKGRLFHWEPAKGTRQMCGEFLPLYESWRAENMLIEEYIGQHPRLNTIFSGCVNTIFFHTVLMSDGHAEIVDRPFMMCGFGTASCANAKDKFTIMIRPDGTLDTYGFSREVDPYGYTRIQKADRHPDTGVIFDGFQLPYWEEMRKLAVESAEKLPELTYIKWDIAVSETGPVVIEGNGMPGSYIDWQMISMDTRKKGIKKELSEFLQAIAFMKALTPEKIRAVNQEISREPTGCMPQYCDTVIVLGSTRCTSRISAAFDAFGVNGQYIVCGGSASGHLKDPGDPDQGILTEAGYMRQYLMERGVDPRRIFTDNNSSNTRANLIQAAKLLRRMGSRKAAIVSAWFHGRRVFQLVAQLNYLGLSEDCLCFLPAYGEQTRPDNWFQSLYGVEAIYHEVQYGDSRAGQNGRGGNRR